MSTRRIVQSQKHNVGGVEVTVDEIATAIETLVVSNGIMVRQPLAKVGSPLAACDYHAVADAERQETGEKLQTKVAFIAALRRIAPGVGRHQHGRARLRRPAPVGVAARPGGLRPPPLDQVPGPLSRPSPAALAPLL